MLPSAAPGAASHEKWGDREVEGLRAVPDGMAADPERVFVASLSTAGSLRIDGENVDHTRLLAEVETELPPIVVHRSTMRVVDGLHRLRAAVLRGDDVIDVLFFDGTSADAFVLAVELNHAHGLPLSRADRTAAAERIIAAHPEWSNRRIAAVTGIAATTVGVLRRRSTDRNEQLDTRVGADGRARPSDAAEGRRRAGEVIARNPNASLREIAKAAGVSPTTAGDVRARLRRGEEPIPQRRRKHAQRASAPALGASEAIVILKRDPALRFSEPGRALLRFLDTCAIDSRQWEEIVESVPSHQREIVIHLARAYAGSWTTVANRLAEQLSELPTHGSQSA